MADDLNSVRQAVRVERKRTVQNEVTVNKQEGKLDPLSYNDDDPTLLGELFGGMVFRAAGAPFLGPYLLLNDDYGYVTHFSEYPYYDCLLYTSPSPRDRSVSRMPSSA